MTYSLLPPYLGGGVGKILCRPCFPLTSFAQCSQEIPSLTLVLNHTYNHLSFPLRSVLSSSLGSLENDSKSYKNTSYRYPHLQVQSYSGRLKFCARQKYCARHFRRKFEALPDELESYFFLNEWARNSDSEYPIKNWLFSFLLCLFSIPKKSIFFRLFFSLITCGKAKQFLVFSSALSWRAYHSWSSIGFWIFGIFISSEFQKSGPPNGQ